MRDARVLIGATIAPYILSKPAAAFAWLQAIEDGAAEGVQTSLYAALECDGRGLAPYEEAGILSRLHALGGRWAAYPGEGAESITTQNRVQRIVTGLNHVREAALSGYGAYSHVWYMHADTYAPPGSLAKLLALNWPIVGAHVPSYALDGPRAADYPPPRHKVPGGPLGDGGEALLRGDVRVHMSPGASLLVHRSLSRYVPWRTDPVAGLTDDPAYWHDARTLYGCETLVRHDVVCEHYPKYLTPMEHRFTEESRVWTTTPSSE